MTNPYPSDSGSVRYETGARVDGGETGSSNVSESSVGQLIGEVASDLSTLLRKEIELAKAELTAEAKKAGKGAGLLGGAGYAGHMLALFASLALSWAISDIAEFSWGWGFFIVAAIWAVVGTVLYVKGREQMKRVNPKPEQTVATLKEDVQWAKNRTR